MTEAVEGGLEHVLAEALAEAVETIRALALVVDAVRGLEDHAEEMLERRLVNIAPALAAYEAQEGQEAATLVREAPYLRHQRDTMLEVLKELTFRAHLQPEDEWIADRAHEAIAECGE